MTVPIYSANDTPSARDDIDVTCRFDGSARQILQVSSGQITTNTESLTPGDGQLDVITTNAYNLTDTWTAHVTATGELEITRLDP